MDAFKQIRIIFFALVAGQIFYFIVALYLVGNDLIISDKGYNSLFSIVIPIIIVILVISSKFVYKRMISAIGKDASLDEKINSYRTNNLIKFALLEAANILTITFYLLTADFLYIGMFIIVMALIFIYFPGKEKFREDFQLNYEDVEKLNKI